VYKSERRQSEKHLDRGKSATIDRYREIAFSRRIVQAEVRTVVGCVERLHILV
jgi:hypothetical protein